jgi:hypothetical protein
MTKNTFELNISMKGTDKAALRQKLVEIIKEFDDDYGKPRQGIMGEFNLETKISTPIWDGKEY